jgi:hypothetical protein
MAGIGLTRAIWIPSATALVGSICFFAMQPYHIEAPAKMVQYGSVEKGLTIKHPSNWKRLGMSSHAVQDSILFKPSENVRFDLMSDLVGSLMADLSRSGSSMVEGLAGSMEEMSRQNPDISNQLNELNRQVAKKTPLDKVHDMRGSVMKDDYDGYKEGASKKGTLGGLEAVESDFTFKGEGAWGAQKIVGKRVTALTSERAIYLIYYAPENQMKTLGPVFSEMRNSIQFGQ